MPASLRASAIRAPISFAASWLINWKVRKLREFVAAAFMRRAFLCLTFACPACSVRRMMLRVKFVPEDIRRARDDRMLTQEEAARQIGVAPRTFQNWEAGTVTPRAKHMRALVAWLEQAEVAA